MECLNPFQPCLSIICLTANILDSNTLEETRNLQNTYVSHMHAGPPMTKRDNRCLLVLTMNLKRYFAGKTANSDFKGKISINRMDFCSLSAFS